MVTDCKDPRNICIAALQQKYQNSPAAGNLRDESIYPVHEVIPFQIHWKVLDRLPEVRFVNNIVFRGSPVPGLTQDDSFVHYCNKSTIPKHCDRSSPCYCTHLIELELCKVYEFFIHDPNRK